jgi:hypothetical protein
MRPLLIYTLLLLPFLTHAQNPALGVWAGASVEKKFGKSFSVQVNGQVRVGDNFTITRAYLGELGLGYRLNKHWKLGAFYRYTGRRRYNKTEGDYYYRPYHRFYGELEFDHKIWRGLKGSYRVRYQNQFRDDLADFIADRSYVRNKFELAYELTKRVTPFVSADVFYRIGTGIDQVRSKIGTDIELTKRQSISLAVFTDVPVNDGPITDVFGFVAYKIKLK